MNLWADTSLWSDGWPSQNITEWIHFILLICCPRLKRWRTWCCGEFPLLASLRIPPFWAKPDPENPSTMCSIFTQLRLSAAPPELWPVGERPHWAQTRPLIPQLQERKRTILIKLAAICVWMCQLDFLRWMSHTWRIVSTGLGDIGRYPIWPPWEAALWKAGKKNCPLVSDCV